LQNLTINNIRTFVSQTLINLYIFLDTTILIENRNFLIDILSGFNIVVIIFSSIFCRYFKDIFYNRLDIKNIIKFIVNFFAIIAFKKINTFSAKSFNNLICNFDIYIYIVISFTSQILIKLEFLRVIIFYCFCLIIILNYKIFVFIKLYYKKFLARVICFN